MDFLLVNAPAFAKQAVRRFSRPWPPLDLLNLAALLRAEGHGVRLLDCRASRVSGAEADRAAASADRIVVSTTSIDRWQCPGFDIGSVFGFLRRFPSERTWVAGAHGTLRPEWVLKQSGAAGLLLGEPEASVRRLAVEGEIEPAPGLAVRCEGGILAARAPAVDLTSLPVPAFDLLEIERYRFAPLGGRFLVLETARGCPFPCSFCSREMHGKPVRRKTVEQVVEEIERALAETGFRNAFFIDLEFTFHREPVVELCEAIRSRGWSFGWTCQTRFDQIDDQLLGSMKAAGCRLIHFGVETGSERQLKALGKGLELDQIRVGHKMVRRARIETALFLLIGHPGETEEEQLATIELACELDPDYTAFNIVSPYPGTRFHELAGPFEEPFPTHDGSHDLADLERMRRRALRRFYLRPGFWFRRPSLFRAAKAVPGARLLWQLLR